MNSHAQCYGHLFPPLMALASNRDVAGAVFHYRIGQTGPMTAERVIEPDTQAWDRCTSCQDFDSCYRLSLGSLLMDMAVRA